MGLHILPFIAGTTVGALLTYLLKDEEARRDAERIIDKAGSKLKSALRKAAAEKDQSTSDPEPPTFEESPGDSDTSQK
jgi:hypothetical protein